MAEVKYKGKGPAERLQDRLKPSNSDATADVHHVAGSGAQRVHSTVHHSGGQGAHGAMNPIAPKDGDE
jgi:hypothetical protein